MCRTRVDIAALGLYAEVECPQCRHRARVHTVLGNYRLEGVLGIGGMSVVLRAHDIELDRPLAIKVLNESFREQANRAERFEKECAMMARVHHENVTAVYSAGHAYGQFYIAMELVDGKNLELMVSARHPMPPRRALDIVHEVALGLAAAAKAGLLHRDMKPGNVLITRDGHAKVIDFGLAGDSAAGGSDEVIWATPFYVPPETLSRKPEDVRADIYALGMTLRYLLTGAESFEGPTDSISALLECKRKLPPFARECPYMPAPVCRVVDHMTRFSAADRPKSYDDLLEELEEVQRLIKDYGLRIRKPVRDWRRPWFLLPPALAVSIVSGGLYAYVQMPPRPEPGQATVPELPVVLPPEPSALSPAAMAALGKGAYAESVAELLQLADVEPDPVRGAWAARVAYLLAVGRCGDAASAQRAAELLAHRLSHGDRVDLIGRPAFECLAQLSGERPPDSWAPLRGEDLHAQARTLEHSSAPAPVLITQWYVLAEQALCAGDDKLAERCFGAIRAARLPAEWQPLVKALSLPPTDSARAAAAFVGPRTRAASLMSRHRTDEAAMLLRSLADSAGGKTAAEARVLAEVCAVSSAMLDALRRKLPRRIEPGADSERLAELAAEAGGHALPTLAEDARVLGMLLQGEHERAFAHAAREKARLSPAFAVIVADWAARWHK